MTDITPADLAEFVTSASEHHLLKHPRAELKLVIDGADQ